MSQQSYVKGQILQCIAYDVPEPFKVTKVGRLYVYVVSTKYQESRGWRFEKSEATEVDYPVLR